MNYRNSLFREIKVLPSIEQVMELLGLLYVVGIGSHMLCKCDEVAKKIALLERDTGRDINTFSIHHPIMPYFQTMPCGYEKAMEYFEAGAVLKCVESGIYYHKAEGLLLKEHARYQVAHWFSTREEGGTYDHVLKELCTITTKTLKKNVFQREFFEFLLTVK